MQWAEKRERLFSLRSARQMTKGIGIGTKTEFGENKGLEINSGNKKIIVVIVAKPRTKATARGATPFPFSSLDIVSFRR